ncbi:hypothetical protein OAA62_01000 [bacterium]|nr:hypothetical protein [bacterium]
MSNEDIPQEIFILSDSESIKYKGLCYKKIKDFESDSETVNISDVEGEYINCSICDGSSREVLNNEPTTVSERETCLKLNLNDGEQSHINIFNGNSTNQHVIKNDSGIYYISNFDTEQTGEFNQFVEIKESGNYITCGIFLYQIKLNYNNSEKYICLYKDPFNSSCSKKIGFKRSDLPDFFSTVTITEGNFPIDFSIDNNIEESYKDIEFVFNQYFFSGRVNSFLQVIEKGQDLYFSFWNPNSKNISDIKFQCFFGETKTDIELYDFSDVDFDSIKDFEDLDIYGAQNAEKIKFTTDNLNHEDFSFGDQIQLECLSCDKPIYTTENAQSLNEGLTSLSANIRSDFNNSINNLYSISSARGTYDNESNSSIIIVDLFFWTPCNKNLPDIKISIIKPEITIKNSESYINLNEDESLIPGLYDKIVPSFSLDLSISGGKSDFSGFYIEDSSYEINSRPIYFHEPHLITTEPEDPSTPTEAGPNPYPTPTPPPPDHPNSPDETRNKMIYWTGSYWWLNIDGRIISLGSALKPSLKLGNSQDGIFSFVFRNGYYGSPIYKNNNGVIIKKLVNTEELRIQTPNGSAFDSL